MIGLFFFEQRMGPGEGPPPAKKKLRGQAPGKAGKAGKGEGLDGRWMLKLVYPNAASLGPYLEAWLRDIAAASPASASATAINSFGGPASYLSRSDDQPEFKQVGGLGGSIATTVALRYCCVQYSAWQGRAVGWGSQRQYVHSKSISKVVRYFSRVDSRLETRVVRPLAFSRLSSTIDSTGRLKLFSRSIFQYSLQKYSSIYGVVRWLRGVSKRKCLHPE